MELDKWTKLGKALMDAVERLPLEWDLYVGGSHAGVETWLSDPCGNEVMFDCDIPLEQLSATIDRMIEFARAEYAKVLEEVELRAEGRGQ